MEQITKRKLKNKKSNVKINGLKTIYINGQNLYFDEFEALSFDTQPNSRKQTLEYILDSDGKLQQLKNKDKQFFVFPNKKNKYFWIFHAKNGKPHAINNKCGQAHNPLMNNKKELNILQKCLLKHYFDIDINTKPTTNIPIQIVYYVRSFEKLFYLYINEIINSLNNQYYNLNEDPNINEDLFGKTFFEDMSFATPYHMTQWIEKDIDKKKVDENNFNKNHKKQDKCINKTIMKMYDFFYPLISSIINEKNKEQDIYELLQILIFIRNNHVLGLFKSNVNDCSLKKQWCFENANKFLKNAINNLTKKYKEDKLYQYPKIILQKIIPAKNQNIFEQQFEDFVFLNKSKNFPISITKIREFIIKKNKSKYIDNKQIQYVNICYDFLIWSHFVSNKNKKEIIKFLNKIQTSHKNKKYNIYRNKNEIEKLCPKEIYKNLESWFEDINYQIIEEEYNKYIESSKNNETKILQSNEDTNIPDFAGFIFIMCCFLENKEVNEFTNYLIKYLSSIESLLNISFNQYFQDEQNFNYFYNNYPIFKIENIHNLIKYLYKIQIIVKINDQLIEKCNKNINNLDLIYKLFASKNQELLKDNDEEINNKLMTNVGLSRKFTYVIKHVNLFSCKNILEKTPLIEYVISNQISDSQKEKFFSCKQSPKQNKNDAKLAKQICELKEFNFIKNNINKDWIDQLLQIYLSILYLFTKSLKRINSLYDIAWISYDQDWYLYNKYFLKKNIN